MSRGTLLVNSPRALASAWPLAPAAVLEFHRRLPGYEPTPLLSCPRMAESLGVQSVLVKDERPRFGLGAFKGLGASWAVYCKLARMRGKPFEAWSDVDDLRAQLSSLGDLRLCAATAGNHGRAVARVAAWLGFEALIHVPGGTSPARIAAIEGEGARVEVVDGTYEDTLRASASASEQGGLLVMDTAWEGYEEIPNDIVEGYSTMLREIDHELRSLSRSALDVVVLPVGVGSLATAVITHFRHTAPDTVLIAVEPKRAACAMESVRAGRVITLPGPHDSIMAGLNCGRISTTAWPFLREGVDLFCAIDDATCEAGLDLLRADGLTPGPTSGAGPGALLALREEPAGWPPGLSSASRVLLFATEGPFPSD